jgi:hypothetical protein
MAGRSASPITQRPALSAAPKRADQASPPGRIQQQHGAVLLLLADEHLHLDAGGPPSRGKRDSKTQGRQGSSGLQGFNYVSHTQLR